MAHIWLMIDKKTIQMKHRSSFNVVQTAIFLLSFFLFFSCCTPRTTTSDLQELVNNLILEKIGTTTKSVSYKLIGQ
jgi:hypothetical protein